MGICENKNKIKTKEENSQEKNGSVQKFYKQFDSIKDENFKANLTSKTTFCGHPPIPINIILESMKSVCKIITKCGFRTTSGTGFFINISNSKKYIVTANHIIDNIKQEYKNSEIEIQIYNNKKMKINLINRYYLSLRIPIDIALIEIKDTDEIYNDVTFLYYDLNYEKKYEIYKDGYIFTIEHINGENAACASGQIIDIRDNEFSHTIPTDLGSSGCPIILLNNSINVIHVIGIHTSKDIVKLINYGTFIGEILNKGIFKNENTKIRPNCETTENSKKYSIIYSNIIIIKFISCDQLINFPISCKITDSFSTVESKLYKEFPDLKKKNIYFLANGSFVNRKLTLKENNIKVPTSILIDFVD